MLSYCLFGLGGEKWCHRRRRRRRTRVVVVQVRRRRRTQNRSRRCLFHCLYELFATAENAPTKRAEKWEGGRTTLNRFVSPVISLLRPTHMQTTQSHILRKVGQLLKVVKK